MKLFGYFISLIWLSSWILIVWGPFGVALKVMPPLSGFLSTMCGLFLAIVPIIHAIVRMVRKNWDIGTFARLASVVPVGFVISIATSSYRYPPINDVSTDLVRPPKFEAIAKLEPNKGRDMTYNVDFVDIVKASYPTMVNYQSDRSTTEVFKACRSTANQMGMSVIRADEVEGRIEAFHRSGLFGFIDDVSVRIWSQEGKTHMAVRSKSRDGRGDLGKNFQRITQLIAETDAKLQSESMH